MISSQNSEFYKNTFIHIDLKESSRRFTRQSTLPANFVLSSDSEDQVEELVTKLTPRLSFGAFAKFSGICRSSPDMSSELKDEVTEIAPRLTLGALSKHAELRDSASTVCSAFFPLGVPSETSWDGSVSRTGSSDESAQVISPSGRQERLSKHINENAAKTTLMIRNVPGKMTQKELLKEIELTTPGCNFLYLPLSRRREGNVGYAFVNFKEPQLAVQFIGAFQDKIFTNHPNSKKFADVGYATLQGFKENVKFYRRSKVSKSANRPFIKYN